MRQDAAEPRAATLALVVGIGIVLGLAAGWLVHPGSSDGGSPRRAANEPILGPTGAESPAVPAGAKTDRTADDAGSRRVLAQQRALVAALIQGAQASAGAGKVQAAVMLDAAPGPTVAGAERDLPMRTWSMVKVVTAVTLLDVNGGQLGDLDPVIRRALTQSDNCAQRKLVLELFDELGSWAVVKQAVQGTLGRAGAAIDLDLAQLDDQGDAECVASGYAGLSPEDARRPSLLLGTTEWRVGDAVRVAHTLRGRRGYGTPVSDYLLGQLRAPKLDSDAPGAAEQLTASPDWGAGRVFAAPCWDVAYKSGWGGVGQGRFLAGQMGTVELAGGRWAAFALMFHPATQPPDDDPGKAQAPAVMEAGLTALKQGLRRDLNPGCP